MIFICLNVLILVHPHLPTPFTSNPVILPRCWYSYVWRSWYLSTPSPHPCTRTPVIYLRCWPDNIHVFECVDTFLPPPPPSPYTRSSVIWWTWSRSYLEAITKSTFINLYVMVNGCPLQVRMHRFTDSQEVHLGDCFRPSNAPIFKTLS